MEPAYTIIITYIMLEIFEVQWQKADSLMGMLLRMYHRYKKSIVWFLILHPTFYFTVFLAMTTDYHPAILTALFIKTVDIATKILLIGQVFEKRELSQEMSLLLLTPLSPLLPYIGLLVYPPMIAYALL